ncbi:MAG: entericidin A/B family lipoprotein [Halomonadaceae bacterium]|nr:entericidin A/B family lipoprotein [Halomonadaceae bacterium]
MKRIGLWTLPLVLGLLLLGGCNTMHGVGEDIEAGGEAIQNEASSH